MRPFRAVIPEPTREAYFVEQDFLVPRWAWLEWVLRKLRLLKKTYYQDTRLSYKTATIETADIREFLYKFQNRVLRGYNEQITDVYFGRDHFQRFLRDLDGSLSHTFRLDFLLTRSQGHLPCSVDMPGVRVHFIPWFEGFLPVPDPSKHLIRESH